MFLEEAGINVKIKKFADREKEYKAKIRELEDKISALEAKNHRPQTVWNKRRV
jgi:DNA polymerase I-like protein with 3'-5' exonuclease and polymerase domains